MEMASKGQARSQSPKPRHPYRQVLNPPMMPFAAPQSRGPAYSKRFVVSACPPWQWTRAVTCRHAAGIRHPHDRGDFPRGFVPPDRAKIDGEFVLDDAGRVRRAPRHAAGAAIGARERFQHLFNAGVCLDPEHPHRDGQQKPEQEGERRHQRQWRELRGISFRSWWCLKKAVLTG